MYRCVYICVLERERIPEGKGGYRRSRGADLRRREDLQRCPIVCSLTNLTVSTVQVMGAPSNDLKLVESERTIGRLRF